MILLIDNFDSFTFNLVQALGAQGARPRVVRNDALTVADIEALRPERIVISPGPGTPDDAGVSLDVIRAFGGRVPLLGVCLGHQCLGQVFGAKVVRAPVPVHGKTAEVEHSGQGLFEGLPRPFTAARYHSLVVERESLPECLEVTAWHEGLIMGMRHRELPGLEGVQFHPESFLTTHGPRLLGNFLGARR
ncbi:aminodeoxychorismate/anthranilate synthase component II [Myxococcus stipitatus]|uniref:anthranilate synthase component II n=1 Tax=Myxococcus stipitatus TaxID=83455 RepID=UPI001F47034B|nr:aminodeoxychorismate/anthranilate synthase component II [Myxococcus stipitatus]MCE9669709.1 aminodeoxychorismate/anthranilate synthase component II [Myxococcus stipitatus]